MTLDSYTEGLLDIADSDFTMFRKEEGVIDTDFGYISEKNTRNMIGNRHIVITETNSVFLTDAGYSQIEKIRESNLSETMKRILAVLSAILVIGVFAACGNESTEPVKTVTTTTTVDREPTIEEDSSYLLNIETPSGTQNAVDFLLRGRASDWHSINEFAKIKVASAYLAFLKKYKGLEITKEEATQIVSIMIATADRLTPYSTENVIDFLNRSVNVAANR